MGWVGGYLRREGRQRREVARPCRAGHRRRARACRGRRGDRPCRRRAGAHRPCRRDRRARVRLGPSSDRVRPSAPPFRLLRTAHAHAHVSHRTRHTARHARYTLTSGGSGARAAGGAGRGRSGARDEFDVGRGEDAALAVEFALPPVRVALVDHRHHGALVEGQLVRVLRRKVIQRTRLLGSCTA